MSAQLFVNSLLVWSAQICILVALGALAAVTLAHPRARLIFWQLLLLTILVLPFAEPWMQSPPEAVPQVVDNDALAPSNARPVPVARSPWRSEYWLVLVGCGAVLRLLWILTGFLRLRRYRKEAKVLAEVPVPFGSASARWYVHDRVPGPVTYGWIRPSILLPTRFRKFSPGMQEAIACHELVHVRRRDWLFVIAEEFVRALFWFHPAVWFVLSRIQLAREQTVDREVVRLTGNQDRYLDALVAVAAQKIRPDLAPAPLFLKKRHLAARVSAVLQEVSVSKSRLYASLTTVCSAVVLGARIAVWLFPFAAPAQVLPDDPGIVVDAGAKLVHRTPVHAPQGIRSGGTVVLEADLNSKGEVTDARVLSGPEELRKPALASVLDWHYAPDAGLSRVHVTINFSDTGAATRPPANELRSAEKGYQFVGLSAEAEQELRRRLPADQGESVDMQRVLATVREFDSHLHVFRTGPNRVVISALPSMAPPTVSTTDFPPPPPGVSRIRVGGNVQAENLVTKVQPIYPPLAKQARIQGTVRYNALIGRDGTVQSLQLVSGHPLLVTPSSDAVQQWVYRPTLLNGEPAEVVTVIDINFTLSQ